MPLTDTAIRVAKPLEKPQKLFDGNGLFLFITPTGTKSWRVKYRFQGREKLLTLGTYPQLSLKEARAACVAAKKQISDGLDPSREKKRSSQIANNTFEKIAREWHTNQLDGWTANQRCYGAHRQKYISLFGRQANIGHYRLRAS